MVIPIVLLDVTARRRDAPVASVWKATLSTCRVLNVAFRPG
jgi:hypothetical protein